MSKETGEAPSTFEMLAQIASGQGEAWEIARNLIGVANLGLLLAKAATENTTEKISPTRAQKILQMKSLSGTSDKIANTAVRVCRSSVKPGVPIQHTLARRPVECQTKLT